MRKEITGYSTCVGIKTVDVMPMTKGAFYESKGFPLDSNDPTLTNEGYKIEYKDGYVSWSPKDTFDESYRTILDMTWSMALYLLLKGHRIRRACWPEDKYYVSYHPETEHHAGYFLITDSEGIHGWCPTVEDNLTDDWMLSNKI